VVDVVEFLPEASASTEEPALPAASPACEFTLLLLRLLPDLDGAVGVRGTLTFSGVCKAEAPPPPDEEVLRDEGVRELKGKGEGLL